MRQLTTMALAAALLGTAGCGPAVDGCTDLVLDGNETDLDCGGGRCAPCGISRMCVYDSDCSSRYCVAGHCAAAPTCTDFIQNGDETDVDCGGGTCGACSDGRGCGVDADCLSGTCTGNRCVEASFPPVDPSDIYQIEDGAGLSIAPGSQAGYGITASGDAFRLVWTGDGASSDYHEFYGSIFTAGSFTTATAGCGDGSCTFGSSDYMSQPYDVANGQQIDFDSFLSSADNALDGIDVQVMDATTGSGQPIYFDLYVDGTHQVSLVFFADPTSGQAVNPLNIPFGLQSTTP